MSKKLTKEIIEKIAETRNHQIICFENYQNIHSKMQVYCANCNTSFWTTVHSYKNAKKTGCPECKKQISSKIHKGKKTTDETKRKIGEKASLRPGSLKGKTGSLHPRSKGGFARDFKNPSNFDYIWKTKVRKRCQFMCVITLTKQKRKEKGFVCHHLNSYDVHIDQRYVPENGIFIKREVHKQFHDIYGYGRNTEEQFADFCKIYWNFDWFLRKAELQLE